MRLWSLHPKYLDAKGIVALWREGLLAKKVLEGKTKGYKNHPQLDRFRRSKNPLNAIDCFLSEVYNEALVRGYNFDKSKIDWNFQKRSLRVTDKQIAFEAEHLKGKLAVRDPKKLKNLKTLRTFSPHPMFRIIQGKIEDWEKGKQRSRSSDG